MLDWGVYDEMGVYEAIMLGMRVYEEMEGCTKQLCLT
jgi:hypothetical protein